MGFTWDGKTSVKIKYMPVSLSFLQKGRHLLLDGKESLSGDDPKEVATVGTI